MDNAGLSTSLVLCHQRHLCLHVFSMYCVLREAFHTYIHKYIRVCVCVFIITINKTNKELSVGVHVWE